MVSLSLVLKSLIWPEIRLGLILEIVVLLLTLILLLLSLKPLILPVERIALHRGCLRCLNCSVLIEILASPKLSLI